MSAELIDARTKITELTDTVLDVRHTITGKDRSEIIREVMHDWALRCELESTLLQSAMKAKGLAGNRRE